MSYLEITITNLNCALQNIQNGLTCFCKSCMLRCMFFNITFQIATGIFFLLEGIKIAVLQRAHFKENNENIKLRACKI